MAKGSQTFSAVLKLQTQQFKKGIKEVQGMMSGLKKSFLAFAGSLGAGMGFYQLASAARKTATDLSVAQATLENVSVVTKKLTSEFGEAEIKLNNFGENMRFVRGLAEEYGQDLIALTTNFAQFHAAADATNMSLDDQKLVYDSLTKASAFFHMSADRTNDMMNAVTQMMSKGTVTAEELRRQLGNALPGAFGLMAKAMGVSTQQLEKMMRAGEIVSKEALPLLAQQLNLITNGGNFDSLQLSLNRLKNA